MLSQYGNPAVIKYKPTYPQKPALLLLRLFMKSNTSSGYFTNKWWQGIFMQKQVNHHSILVQHLFTAITFLVLTHWGLHLLFLIHNWSSKDIAVTFLFSHKNLCLQIKAWIQRVATLKKAAVSSLVSSLDSSLDPVSNGLLRPTKEDPKPYQSSFFPQWLSIRQEWLSSMDMTFLGEKTLRAQQPLHCHGCYF